MMFKKSRNILLIGGVLAAVSFGGSALAAAGAAPVQPTQVPVKAAKATAPTTADKETADGTTAAAQKGDPETADGAQASGDTGTTDGNQGAGDAETADGGSAAPESSSEIPGNDGPGGHHDEPGNPDAQHEAGGQTEE
jgi:hypothetical protein